jgi:protein YIPF6
VIAHQILILARTYKALLYTLWKLTYPADLNDFDDPLATNNSRQPLTGNIGSSSSSRPLNEGYLTSRIPGEDRRAPQNTIDESVWDTLRRDLLAVWAKLREVLYPRYLLGGTMFDNEGGLRGAYSSIRGAGLSGTREELTGLASRMVDAEALLQSNMTPGLRDWDLWGPLIFCLLLSVLLSITARSEQRDAVFSGVFAMIWLGEAVVTLQIKLLGGNMYVSLSGFAHVAFANLFKAPSLRASASLDILFSLWFLLP